VGRGQLLEAIQAPTGWQRGGGGYTGNDARSFRVEEDLPPHQKEALFDKEEFAWSHPDFVAASIVTSGKARRELDRMSRLVEDARSEAGAQREAAEQARRELDRMSRLVEDARSEAGAQREAADQARRELDRMSRLVEDSRSEAGAQREAGAQAQENARLEFRNAGSARTAQDAGSARTAQVSVEDEVGEVAELARDVAAGLLRFQMHASERFAALESLIGARPGAADAPPRARPHPASLPESQAHTLSSAHEMGSGSQSRRCGGVDVVGATRRTLSCDGSSQKGDTEAGPASKVNNNAPRTCFSTRAPAEEDRTGPPEGREGSRQLRREADKLARQRSVRIWARDPHAEASFLRVRCFTADA